MSYTPPNTFVAGAAINAADVQGNIDAIQDYANDRIPSGDLAATAWCKQQHIVSPEHNPTTQTTQMVSGSISEAERPRFTSRYTYAQRANSNTGTAVGSGDRPAVRSSTKRPSAALTVSVQWNNKHFR